MTPSDAVGLRILRVRRRLTLKALAARLYVSPSTVSRWENGLRRPHPSVLPRLADALAVDVAEVGDCFADVPPTAAETLAAGAGLSTLRRHREVTRRQLAARTGVAVATVAHWECGRRQLPMARVPAVAAALGVGAAELLAACRRRPEPDRLSPSRLGVIRRQAGLTRVEAARLLAVSPRTVSSWENGPTRMPRAAAAVLADRLGMSVEDVIDESGAGELAGARRIGAQSPEWARCLVRFGVSQHEIATRVGVHRQTVGRWERGRTVPTAGQRQRIDGLVRSARRRTRYAETG